ncbi:DMT family transporter [Polymorphum gilvum]|uniref:EamA domain-containing protein n=1 Tax=Polymorphum gilvum (strain LMG 25793 / CGMCC 1.9160 / SL003B-26A1) TaxID=991905 RepID=F2J6V9_POLGS|nr:DMT family transporter [Polymorphum gilvum]ADZ72592.1 hypothetical protein SL003B_4175 [Polymorphum gilvum SL003B-26A1]
MSLFGLTLVLAAAFCHATWNFFVKRIGGGPELVWLFSVVSVVLYMPLALYLLVTAAPEFGPEQIGFLAGSTVLHLAYFLLLQRGYRVGDLSLVYPVARATGPLLSTGFAVAFLGERISGQIALGGLAVIVGVLFLTGGIRRSVRSVVASIGFGLGAGLLIGSYTVWDAHAVAALAIPPLLLDYVSTCGRIVLLAPLAMRRRQLMAQHWRNHRGGVVAIALFNPLAYILVLHALIFTPVVYVAPTRELSVLLTVVAGSILLGEGHLRRRLPWAGVIVAGVALLATG